MDFVVLFDFLAATDVVSGLIAGLLGIGGGVVLVPAPYYVFEFLGYESDRLMQVCAATSGGAIIFNSARSVLMRHRRGAVDWSVLKRRGQPFLSARWQEWSVPLRCARPIFRLSLG